MKEKLIIIILLFSLIFVITGFETEDNGEPMESEEIEEHFEEQEIGEDMEDIMKRNKIN